MKFECAKQIANLLNSRNQLTRTYDAARVLKNAENFIYELSDDVVIACIETKRVQWYQWEVCHLTVATNYEGRGYGSRMIQKAEEKAKLGGARIVQCTIRADNEASNRAFEKNGYKQTSCFFNSVSGNDVLIWQKVISVNMQNTGQNNGSSVKEIEKLQEENLLLQAEIDTLQERIYELESIEKEKIELEAENFRLEGEVFELEVTVDNLESQVEHLAGENECLVESLAVAQGNEIELEGKIELLREEIEQINEDMNDMDGLFVSTRRLRHFHRPHCEWITAVPSWRLVKFSSHEEAVKAGCKPCKTCRS